MRAALLACLISGAAAAQNPPKYLGFKMLNTASDPFKYYLDSRNPSPGGLAMTSVQAATVAAWGTWNAVACATPKTQLQGFSVGVVPKPSDPYDAFNVTPVWLTSQQDPDWQFIIGSYQIKAITLPLSYAGVLNQCDIYMNGANATFSTAAATPAGSIDLETVMLHEAGHCLGIDHFGLGNVMRGDVTEGAQQRALTQQDIDALCQRNPVQFGIGSPCPDGGGCGSVVPGIKCVTQPLPTGSAKYCTVGCAVGTNTECDVPLYCQSATFFNPAFDGACLRSANTVTNVGAPCNGGTSCGSSIGLCQPQETSPSQFPRWTQGYCTQDCATGHPPCPAGSTCIDTSGGAQDPICLASCRVGLADCRPDYTCALTNAGGVCIPICHTDVDCGNSALYQCRTCDGLCVDRQNATGQIGDVCTADSQCGAGQVCDQIDPLKPGKLCTVSCGKGCGTCPTGSGCHPMPPTNQLECLRTCSGPGTCPTGSRCANLATGRGCVPPCLSEFDCPVGENCVGGECYGTDLDAGCAPFCTVDSGHPIIPKKDGGQGGGGGGSGGCGCTTHSDLTALFVAAMVLATIARRRQGRGLGR